MIVGIYKKENKLFFTSFSKIKNGPRIMGEPILISGLDEDEETLGKKLMTSFSYCKELESGDGNITFKKLLKISNSKSHKEFVEKAKYIKATIRKEQLKLILIGADLKKKAFVIESDLEPITLDLKYADMSIIGQSIRLLFN